MMIEDVTAGTFSEILNTRFRLNLTQSDVLELELIKVEDLATSAKQERFSVIFRGPRDRGLSQGTYSFEHDKLGTLDLFIVPIGMEEDGVVYEAAFNRLKKT
jgi:hypothetical protein